MPPEKGVNPSFIDLSVTVQLMGSYNLIYGKEQMSYNKDTKPLWIEEEVALLLQSIEMIKTKKIERKIAIIQLSEKLRKKCIERGINITDKTRNYAGVELQMINMEYYLKTGIARNISKLFQKIANMMKKEPDKFSELLDRASKEYNEFTKIEQSSLNKNINQNGETPDIGIKENTTQEKINLIKQVIESDNTTQEEKFNNFNNFILKNFSHGFRPESVIDTKNIINKFKECNDKEYEINKSFIQDYAQKKCVFIKDKAYAISNDSKTLLDNIIDDLKKDYSIIYYTELYKSYSSEFKKNKIFSPEILKKIIISYKNDLYIKEKFFTFSKVNSLREVLIPIFSTCNNLTLEYICQNLKYVPGDIIKKYLQYSGFFLFYKNFYYYIENIEFDEDDIQKNYNLLANLAKNELIELNDLKFDNTIELNPLIPSYVLKKTFFEKYLSDKYLLKNSFIVFKSLNFNITDYISNLLKNNRQISIDQLFEQTDDKISRTTAIKIIRKIAIQIDEIHFVALTEFNFDTEIIDNILEKLIPKEGISIRKFSDYSFFPNVSQFEWNAYVLMSYCNVYSEKFSFATSCQNNLCYGIICRKIDVLSYHDLVIRLISEEDIEINPETITKYIKEFELYQRARKETVSIIINKIQQIKKA